MSDRVPYEEITLRLSQLKSAVQDDTRPESVGDDELVAAAVAWRGSPRQDLHVLYSTLVLCAQTATPRRWTLPALQTIATRLLDRSSSTTAQFERVHSLPLLELLVAQAARAGDFALARRALRRLAQRVNELFLRAQLGPEFLSVREPTGSIENAARWSFEGLDTELAVLCAEAGRMKLLSSVAAGALPLKAALDEHVEHPRMRDLFATTRNPDVSSVREAVDRLHESGQLGLVLQHLVSPWRPLLWTEDEPIEPVPSLSDDLWDIALREPTLEWIGAELDDGAAVVYPFFGTDWWGFVFIARPARGKDDGAVDICVESMLVTIDDVRDLGLPTDELVLMMVVGAMIPAAVRERFGDSIALEDIRVVAWQPSRTRDVVRIAWGVVIEEDDAPRAMGVIPSARLLPRRESRNNSSSRLSVGFVGDPSENLVGPWVEAIEWSLLLDDRAQFAMGPRATKAALLDSLANTDVTVVSGHGLVSGQRGDIVLQLADGQILFSDLFEHQIRSEFVILSCCSAGRIGSGGLPDEMLGLSTALLAMGVRQVLAPTVPIADNGAAVLGALVAREVANGADLRGALGRAARGLSLASELGELVTIKGGVSHLADECPHDPRVLAATRKTSADRVYRAMLEFAVFGS